jgi:hypothetical protein
MKKILPFLFLLLLLAVAVLVNRQNHVGALTDTEKKKEVTGIPDGALDRFRNPDAAFYFTKHARCRMQCRRITQEEVKEIVRSAQVNLRKSDPDAAGGPKYALEGYTSVEKQHVRVIVAPKKRHLTIVTVIDLDEDWVCPDCK